MNRRRATESQLAKSARIAARDARGGAGARAGRGAAAADAREETRRTGRGHRLPGEADRLVLRGQRARSERTRSKRSAIERSTARCFRPTEPGFRARGDGARTLNWTKPTAPSFCARRPPQVLSTVHPPKNQQKSIVRSVQNRKTIAE